MTQTLSIPDDHVSALMDGELQGSAQQAAIAALLEDARAQGVWHDYHLVGDILRSEELATGANGLQFLTKLEKRLSMEVMAPRVAMPVEGTVLPVGRQRQTSANEDRYLWRGVAGGIVTFALAMSVVFFMEPNAQRAVASLAAAPQKSQDVRMEVAVTEVAADGMIRDPRFDQLLNAHQQLGGHSALQMPSGFLRNATYDGKGR